MKKKELTWKQAIDLVLADAPTPMNYRDIAQEIIERGLRKNLGATPSDTVGAQISSSIKHEGDSSRYIRIGKGVYCLRDKTDTGKHSQTVISSAKQIEQDEAQYDIVTSFGMFWRRTGVEWKSKPRLLGMEAIDAKAVDFHNQLGVYLLYDGREVIYVGRSTDRPLGRRLYEHTSDRLSTRWDRFSWFGLLPISDKGELGEMPERHEASLIIPAFEAILIEALEPRQNRKRGDKLSSVEFIQKIDPAIKKQQLLKMIDDTIPN